MNTTTHAIARAFLTARNRGLNTLAQLEELALHGFAEEIGLAIAATRASLVRQVDTTCRLVIEAEIAAAGGLAQASDFEYLIPVGTFDLDPIALARTVSAQLQRVAA
ncbi:hypothetical protein [Aquimonas sp.]|jgi:hypothetical protein|uniref:hypothetical protein n=1 Tax=Aquimonas sp. TaxID=1872588 RepID=UPI0037C1846C